MTQGKIERYHRSMKNRILLDNYYLPGQLEQSIEEFVSYYNNCRYHESLDNLTPADVYFGRGQAILERTEKIRRTTIDPRRRLHQQAIAAGTFKPDEPDILLNSQANCTKCSDDRQLWQQGQAGMAQQQHGTVRVTQAVETSLRRPTGIHLSENLKAAVDLVLNRAVCTTARLP